MKYILGIDPGINGGLALLSDNDLQTFEIPTLKTTTAKGKKKKVLDEPELARMIDSWSKDISFCIIEKVHAMPNQGTVSMFNFGRTYGILEMAVIANFIKLEYVSPQAWKGSLRVSAIKNKSRERASEIFPKHSDQWCKAKWDGRAEAAMIAYYAFKNRTLLTPKFLSNTQ